VWTHTGLSFSANIFTNLPLVHTLNPDFLGQQLWLCFSPGSWMSSRETPELGLQQFPELAFASPLVRACPRAWLPNSAPDSSRFRASACSWLHFFTEPRFPNRCTFANSRLHRFQASENREFPAPKKHASRTLLNSTFRGWRVFLNSPTLAPRGSGLTPTIRFHESFGNLVKNVTLRTSEGTRVAREIKDG
jgi:hypothetical protein